jgi:hypothetical protein
LIVAFSKDAPIGLVGEDFRPAPWLGLIGFAAVIVWLYGWMVKRAREAPPGSSSASPSSEQLQL